MNPAAASVVALILQYKYFIIFPLTVIEGPIVTVLSGFLYHFGRPLIEKHGKFLSIKKELFDKIEAKFHDHQNKILLVSKMTMGFGFSHATLIGAGIVRIPFKKY